MAKRDVDLRPFARRREVLDIQEASRKAWNDHVRHTARYKQTLIEGRERSNSRRIETPPRDRPMAALKRDIYRLACEIHDRGHQNFLEMIVLRRQQYLELTPKLRSKTVIDWTVRLVRYAKAERQNTARGGGVTELFSGMHQTRIVTELKFAFENNIDPELCTAFIGEIGGYEIIGLMSTEEKNSYNRAAWVERMKRPVGRRAQMTDSQASSGKISSHVVEDPDDWEEDDDDDLARLPAKTCNAEMSGPPKYDADGWELEDD